MRRFLSVVFSLCFIVNTFGQSPDNLPHKSGVGFSVGSSIGSGFSFRYNVSEKFGVQPTVTFPLYNINDKYEFNKSTLRIGISLYYNIVVKDYIRFFAYGGGKYVRKIRLEERYLEQNWVTEEIELTNYAGGIGFGLEFYIKPNIGFNVMLGYGAFDNDGDFKTGISGESSILFYFK